MNKQNKIFMAFAAGKESTEGTGIKRYIGIAPVTILAVNPTKAALEKLYGITLEKDPEYLDEIDVNGSKVKRMRLDFIVKTDPEKSNGIELITKVSFFINNMYAYYSEGTKVAMINKYGEVAILPEEDAKANITPANMSWFDTSDMRPAYVGEKELIAFLKAYLNIPNKSYQKKDGTVVTLPNPADAEARLEKIANFFKGDISELKEAIALQPSNKVKVCFGVKNTEDNKLYQAVYTGMFYKNNVTDYSRLDKEIQDKKNSGYLANVEYAITPLKEYEVLPTNFDEAPAASTDAPKAPWAFQNK